MRHIKLGGKKFGFEKRVTNHPETGEYIFHRHLILFGHHFCLAPSAQKHPIDPIQLFQALCRRDGE